MRHAKSGEWWKVNDHFKLANNSAVYTERPTSTIFMEEWLSLIKSGSGERGIFSRAAAQRKAAENGRRDASQIEGTNPCSEILLRDRQFCNLTSVINRDSDSFQEWLYKIESATILGTVQSTLTDSRSFDYLSDQWKKNSEEERLLGVSMNGVFDSIYMNGLASAEEYLEWTGGLYDNIESVLEAGKAHAVEVNLVWSKRLGIKQAGAITCNKPDGTNSQLVGCGSGMHAWHARKFIRTNRANMIDPVAQLMKDSGIPCEEEITYPDEEGNIPAPTKWVFSFPAEAPEHALIRKDLSAIQHLKLWLTYAKHWCEHKPSITVSVRDHEWFEVGAFVYEHFDYMSGVSFFPMDEHTYQQAPLQDCTEEEWQALKDKMPASVNWSDLVFYEADDTTTGSREFACVSGPDGVINCG
jgi:ribonucleoside-diphosphate reductase alpha chain